MGNGSKLWLALAVAALLWAPTGFAEARSFRVNQVPNGSQFGCNLCHTSGGGSPRNAFGLDIENNFLDGSGNVQWTAILASRDSDGDGVTNGVELGDPNGTGTPAAGATVTHPGDATSFPQVQNRAPVFGSLPDSPTVSEGEEIRFTLTATDEDGDAVTFSAADLPTGAELSGAEFVWTPGFDVGGGAFTVNFTVTDGSDATAGSVAIDVQNVDRPLEIAEVNPAIGSIAATPGAMLLFAVTASDPDGDDVVYTWKVGDALQVTAGPSFEFEVTDQDNGTVVSVSVASGGAPEVRQWTIATALQGDFNANGAVDFSDFVAFAGGFGKTPADVDYNTALDLNGNDSIDFGDFIIFASFFGKSLAS